MLYKVVSLLWALLKKNKFTQKSSAVCAFRH